MLDFTRRTKGARRERIGLANALATALSPHFDRITLLYPKGETPAPASDVADVVDVDSRSDILSEEVLLPFVLKRLRATHAFTFRDAFVLPKNVVGHLHLHEDPGVRRRFERQVLTQPSPKAALSDWRNERRFLRLLHDVRTLTTSSKWTLESLRRGPAGAFRAVRGASVAYLGGFADSASRATPRPYEARSHVLIHASTDPRDDPSWALGVYADAIAAIERPPPAVVFGVSQVTVSEIRGHIQCAGYISDERALHDLYGSALAYIHPTWFEGFGLMPVEAMQCGTPVLAPAGSSNAEAIASGAHASRASAATALRALLADRDAWTSASGDAWRRGKIFQWERCAAGIAAQIAHDA